MGKKAFSNFSFKWEQLSLCYPESFVGTKYHWRFDSQPPPCGALTEVLAGNIFHLHVETFLIS